MRLRYTLLFTLFFLVGPAKAAPQKSDRERDGLKGPVRSIVWKFCFIKREEPTCADPNTSFEVETVEYDAEGKRTNYRSFREACDTCLAHIVTHDSRGRVSKERVLEFTLWPIFTITNRYNLEGNLIESNEYDSLFGGPYRKWIYQYEYDSYGNWIKQTHLMQDAPFDTAFSSRQRGYRIIYYWN
jgi:hypothetical protein